METANKKIKVAIVILNWNGRKFLEKFLPSVVEYSAGAEVIIADNDSKDDSVSFLKEHYPQLRIILNNENGGYAKGYNDALAQVDAEYYVLLNSDIEVTPGWVQPVIDVMDADPGIAAAQPKLLSYAQKDEFEYAGAAGGFIDKYGYPFCRGRILDTIEKDEGQYDDAREIFWTSGACMFVRSDIFHAHNGFDDDFFAHMEEIDLCWRMKNSGYKIMYYSDVTVFHVGGGVLPNNSPFKLYLNYRNNLFMLYKNLPGHNLYFILFLRMVLDGLSAIVYLVQFNFKSFVAVLKAHFSLYASIKKLNKKRKLQPSKLIHKEQFPESILLKYFLKKQKKFKNFNF